MQNQKLERILAGQQQNISNDQLLQLQAIFATRNLPLEQAIEISLRLYRSNFDHCLQFLVYLDKNELIKPAYNDIGHQAAKITIYNNLTGLTLAKAIRSSSRQEYERLMSEARRYLNSSEKVRMTVDKSIILNRAFLHYYGGQVTKALNFVNRTYQQINKTGEGRNLLGTTTLVLAQMHFAKKNYSKSLQLYKKCLQTNKTLPTKARLGMAYSFYYVGKYQLARACFQRIVKLDPTCIQAYVGIAVVYDKQQNFAEYFKYIKLAYRINKQHPLVLVHLAQHFLLTGDLVSAEKSALNGLQSLEKYPKFLKIQQSCRNDYEQYRARFNNILGQINHINSNYAEAIKYYTLAVGKGLLHNDVALAQTYINPNSQNYIEAIRLIDDSYKQYEGKDSRLLNDSYRLMAYLKSKIPPKGKDERGAEFYYGEALKYNKQDYQSKIQYASILVQTNKLKALKQLQQVEKILLTNGTGVKPQLQNNIAVLLLQNGQIQFSEKRLLKCLKLIEQIHAENQEQETRKESLLILSKFNYAICLEKQMKWESSCKLYEQILLSNKYHLDSYMRLAYVLYQIGNYTQVLKIFQEVDKLCLQTKNKLIRPERMFNIKAYIQQLAGTSSEAKQTIKQFGKHKDIYTQVFELSLNYQAIMRKGVELSTFKEFLRPNREFCFKYCNEDHNATFAYMLLAIILLSDKKINKTQGIQFFNNLKQFSSEEIPSILYNMGLFFMNYDDHQSSNAVLTLFKQKIGCNCKSDELISLNYLLENNFRKSQSYIKRNILREPSNMKYRLQLAYATERRCHKYYEGGDFIKREVQVNLQNLKSCMNFYNYLSKISISDHIRGVQLLEVKERLRNLYLKIKQCGEERKYYIKSYIESYQKIHRQVDFKERQKLQNERIHKERLDNEKKDKQLQQLLQDQEDSEDEEEKERKEKEKKKQRALELAKKRQAQLDSNWNDIKEKEKNNQNEKKSRNKTNTGTKSKGKRQKQKEESSFEEIQQIQQSSKSAAYAEESDPEPKKKHKHEKKEKKHKRKQTSDEQAADPFQSSKSKKQDEPPQEDEDQDMLLKYKI